MKLFRTKQIVMIMMFAMCGSILLGCRHDSTPPTQTQPPSLDVGHSAILYQRQEGSAPAAFFAYEIHQGEARELPYDVRDISPNGEWLAVAEYDQSGHLEGIGIYRFGEAEPDILITWEEGMSPNVQWLDDNHIAIPLFDAEQRMIIGGAMIIDPWTDERQVIRSDYEFASDGNTNEGYFSRNYEYVVYRNIFELSLYNVLDREVTWSIVQHEATLWGVSWAPSATEFVYKRWVSDPGTFEMFLVNTSGQETQLTNMSNDGENSSLIMSPSWSPDGEYVAFWWEEAGTLLEVDTYQLMMVSVETGEVTDFAVYQDHPPTIEWAPDSQAVAVVSLSDSNEDFLVTVDIHNGQVDQLLPVSGNVRLIEWCNCLTD